MSSVVSRDDSASFRKQFSQKPKKAARQIAVGKPPAGASVLDQRT
ncbi:MAG: hypothetical protein ACREUU_08715 [Gammaproteobacteria bacterium]